MYVNKDNRMITLKHHTSDLFEFAVDDPPTQSDPLHFAHRLKKIGSHSLNLQGFAEYSKRRSISRFKALSYIIP